MQDHTTLLITAEQVALLDEYSQLARFLQPAMVVIEDADLIARARVSMRSPCEESLLNRLLNTTVKHAGSQPEVRAVAALELSRDP